MTKAGPSYLFRTVKYLVTSCILSSVPYKWLFPKCATAIHHGGSGSTAAALHAGIPQMRFNRANLSAFSIVCPFMLDQFYWAERMFWVGVSPEPLKRNQLLPDEDDEISIKEAANSLARSIDEYNNVRYWGLHLIGVWLGHNLLFEKNANLRTNNWARKRVWILFIFFWFLTLILDSYVERPSRRMCNLTYVTLILATNLEMLAILILSDYISGGKVSLLEQAINRNLLAFFIVANLLTGLLNLSMDTLFVSPLAALLILIAYAFVVCAAAAFADYNGIKFKFW